MNHLGHLEGIVTPARRLAITMVINHGILNEMILQEGDGDDFKLAQHFVPKAQSLDTVRVKSIQIFGQNDTHKNCS